MPADERDRIIIFGWDIPKKKILTEKSVGHVSLQTITPKGYHSFWPKFKDDHRFYKKEPYVFKTFGQDIVDEGRNPDWVVCLYTLSGDNIDEKATLMKQEVDSWCPNGTEHDESCASFVYRLLDYAGIEGLYKSSSFSRKTGCSMTPAEMKNVAFRAKLKEHDDVAPETQAFTYGMETPIEEIRSSIKTTSCCIL